MENPTERKEYKKLLSTKIISIMAAITCALGFACIITPFFGGSPGLGLGYGFACIGASAFMFAMSNVAEDVHYQIYLKECNMEETARYHAQSLQKLSSIESMMYQILSKRVPNEPVFYPQEPQYAPPQEVFILEQHSQETQSLVPDQHSGSNEDNRQNNPQEDDEPEYKAQFMRPTPQKKKISSAKK